MSPFLQLSPSLSLDTSMCQLPNLIDAFALVCSEDFLSVKQEVGEGREGEMMDSAKEQEGAEEMLQHG